MARRLLPAGKTRPAWTTQVAWKVGLRQNSSPVKSSVLQTLVMAANTVCAKKTGWEADGHSWASLIYRTDDPDGTAAERIAFNAKMMGGTAFEIDVTTRAIDFVGINSFQIGWQMWANPHWIGETYTSPAYDPSLADVTTTVIFDYTALKPTLALGTGEAFVCIDATSWLAEESEAPGVQYYLDNFRVTGIPEPATMALLGLGGLALIRRKK